MLQTVTTSISFVHPVMMQIFWAVTTLVLSTGALVLRPRMTVSVALVGFIFGFLTLFGIITKNSAQWSENCVAKLHEVCGAVNSRCSEWSMAHLKRVTQYWTTSSTTTSQLNYRL